MAASIWYLDDETALVTVVTRLLQRAGHDAIGFHDPDLAVAALADTARPVNVFITDLNMPKRSGLDVAAAARGLRPALPVVLCSGSVSLELQQDADRVGVDRVIYKPDMARALAAIVSELLMQ